MKKTKVELQVRNREIQDRMAELEWQGIRRKREFNPLKSNEWDNSPVRLKANDRELKNLLNDQELAQVREKEDKNAALRELFQATRATSARSCWTLQVATPLLTSQHLVLSTWLSTNSSQPCTRVLACHQPLRWWLAWLATRYGLYLSTMWRWKRLAGCRKYGFAITARRSSQHGHRQRCIRPHGIHPRSSTWRCANG